MDHKKISIFLLLATLLPGIVSAAEFNPNSIISDAELQDVSMNRADIQAFLVSKNSFLSTFKAEDVNGDERLASDIIYQAAKEYGINPKYILVKLQKEQSLIKDPDPTQKQLDWAAGYAVCDSCSMSDPAIQKHKGFGTQVDSAAGIMRWYYDNMSTQSFIKRAGKTYTIDDTEVTPQSNATGFLYTYTPHLHGNENFWKLWQEWFAGGYPDGSLLKSVDSPDIYVLREGKKSKITSMSALVSRYNPNMILTVPSSELARYENGPTISFANYSILKEGSDYYLLDFDTLRRFKSETIFQKYGYNPGEVIDVDEDDIEGYKEGKVLDDPSENPIGRIIRAKETKSLYYIKDDTFAPILDEQIPKLAFPTLKEQPGSFADLKGLNEVDPVLFPDGTILGITGSNKIYAIEHGTKRHIADEVVFNGLGYKWSNVIWTNEMMGLYLKTGEALYLQTKSTTTPSIDTSAPTSPTKPSTTEEVPVSDEDTIESQMVRATKTVTEGPVFETDIDTYLVAEYKTGKILAGKNIDTLRPLASFTKVLTGYQLFEEGINERAITTYSKAKHNTLYNHFRIAEGEQVRNSDLLDAFLVSSLNSPGRMLVSSLGANEKTFISSLNDLAESFGAELTKIVDVSGVEVGNQSTARDYLAIFSHILKRDEMVEYLSKKSYEYAEILDTDGKPNHYDVHSNALVNKTNLGFTIQASKTGYLYEAGANLAMLVTRPSDGKQFIVITMGNVDYDNRFAEPERFTKWALSKF